MHASFAETVQQARKSGSTLLAFNVVDLASLGAVVAAAGKATAPVIVQYSSRTVKFYGAATLVAATRVAAQRAGATAFVHLDHCRDDDVLAEALESGFDGIMADGSHLPLDENIRWTSRWRERSHRTGSLLEAEFTGIRGEEDGIAGAQDAHPFSEVEYTRFCTETMPDFAGADIGTHHGHYASAPTIDFGVIRAAATKALPAFVVHGGSGLSADVLRQLADNGVVKVNFSTDLKDAWLRGISGAAEREPLELLRRAQVEVESTVLAKFHAIIRVKT